MLRKGKKNTKEIIFFDLNDMENKRDKKNI